MKKIIILLFLMMPCGAYARGRMLVPTFSKTWWKYAAINCAMFQAKVSYQDLVYRDMRAKYQQAPVPGPVVLPWYPVTTPTAWQIRRKELGGPTIGN